MKSFVLTCLAVVACAPAFAEDVTVTLTGVKAGGELLGSLQTRDEFMQPRASHGAVAKPVSAGTVVLVFKDVAPGEYAMSVLHDMDGDRDMKRAASGMPEEGWAMRNAAALRAAPTFDAVSFKVDAAPVAFTEAMIYPQD